MSRIGSYEAKTHLPRLLERVERGETFTITRHGVAIAELRPVQGSSQLSVEEAITALREFRQHHALGDTTLRQLIEDGRHW